MKRNKFAAIRRLLARKDFLMRQYGLDRALQQVLEANGRPISGTTLAAAYEHWGDPLSQPAERFLISCLAEASKCKGDVLQCGAGLSTLLLGAVCGSVEGKPRHVWCLEHDRHWANHLRMWLTEYDIQNVHIIVTRPRLFDGFVWYSVEPHRLPDNYRLAICQGTRSTPRGVVGLIHLMQDRFAAEGVILAKDVFADRERLTAWAVERGVNFVVVDKKSGFIKIAPGHAEGAPRNPSLANLAS